MHNKKTILKAPPIATGMIDTFRKGYRFSDFKNDALAGLTIGTVAVPLSMALAIATGVPPEHGLYTAIVAGALIALTGGSRFNISGPTAAFVVILFPIVKDYGIGGLLLATMMAGTILLLMGLSKMGQLIRFVPYPVVLGFTAGIAIIIAILQIPDFLGLHTEKLGDDFVENISIIFSSLGTINPYEMGVGLFTLVLLILWPKFKIPLPAPLVGLIVGGIVAYFINKGISGAEIKTIASNFTWHANGMSGNGIPPIPPSLIMPWALPGPDGQPLVITYKLIHSLTGPAFAIATLGAIESLLCAVIADELTDTKHNPNAELIGQGIGNIVAPLFGGITATAAIARTATSIRSGAKSPIAAIIHSIFVLLAVVLFASLLGFVPMASLGALLFIVAWNMSEAKHCIQTIKTSPRSDVIVLLICFGLTIIFDMVIAVAVGVALSAILFIRSMTYASKTALIEEHPELDEIAKDIVVFDINGPLFFGVSERTIASFKSYENLHKKIVVLDMKDVISMDGTTISGLQSIKKQIFNNNQSLIFVGVSTEIILSLKRAGLRKIQGKLTYCSNFQHARDTATRWLNNR
ncbi:C4-dicarboxylic acid transporter DauA [Commensalibacter communis]|uniref:MFS superfamily (SUL1) n=1 Tax=Commensalibacter communis TaxID=2972786 RepID=A0A9W4TN40_9PROT|nr:C4-dicarboxylic acid transporter DauA [Commensalibacter communis]CAI3923319.1 MFS superfamily (SUL1) (PDB:3NY7) [Commensalibacter communis]CAI3930019.1 MFS superfamily (SUL1) (PDB:3NY7) [Commensalibacter communis]CAI3930908.1 MFS superfamily (SUL1) (PDB:3NY7) [Commensalibacter communis]CAI3931364.1 MFS superfamily (SUL1) (PDB:3NY7) [Commensalibacter communis]CAI3931457.1 MFS superfamily (SUL1) (PDB:3NY7) [Commensalibacter communis]